MQIVVNKKLIGSLGCSWLLLLSACATQAPAPSPEPQPQAAVSTDTSTPAAPVAPAATAETIIPPEEEKAPEEPPKPGSYASVLEKLNKDPFTLYWRETGAYTYTIGKELDARYKPGEGLVVKANKADKTIVCEFNEKGELVNVNADPKTTGPDQCSEVMFTLDQELSSDE